MSDAAYDDAEEHIELSDEERARVRGWKPLEEWKGDPTKWRSLEEFLRVGEDSRVLAAENRRLTERLARQERRTENELSAMRKTAEEQTAAITALTSLARRADKQGYERARAELVEQRKLAVETGDTSAFEQIEERMGALDKAHREVEAPPPARPTIAPEITAFATANAAWFVPGSELHKAMVAHYEIVERRFPDATLAEALEIAKKRLIADFPERFPRSMAAPAPETDDGYDDEPTPRRRAPSVATPAPAPRRPNRTPTGWDQIEDPGERAKARAAFDAIKRGDANYTEEEYLAVYLDPRADELALRASRKA